MFTLSHANILNGTKDMVVQEDMNIIIDHGKIIEISKEEKGDVIDCTGKYITPGLINLHVHLPGSGYPKKKQQDNTKLAKLATSNKLTRFVTMNMCENYAKIELQSGVTTIRCVGGLDDYDTTIRDKGKLGKINVPRMLVSNRAITVPNGHMAGSVGIPVRSASECIEAFNHIVKDDVDLIKIMITGGVLDAKKAGEPGEVKMSSKLVSLVCDLAHKKGLKVAAHVESSKGIEVSLENGVDTIEHGAMVNSKIIDLYKKRNASVICTISPAIPFAKFDKNIMHIDDVIQYNGNIVLEGIIDNAKKAIKHDISVGLGTDTACPYITHYDMWRELVYFEKLVGVSKQFALYSATLNNAQIAGIDSYTGSIEIGKSADLLVLDSNPLEDLSSLRNVEKVFLRGNEIKDISIKKNKQVEMMLDEFMSSL